jgi:predicted kinase
MLVGLPASGKSSYAKELSQSEDATIFSSDELRKELYGDVNHQDNNGEVFVELYKRAKEQLKNGQSAILDATNINSKRRIATLKEFKQYECEVYYFSTEFDECVIRDFSRDRKVGNNVLDRMYKNLTLPTYAEGWNKIHIVSEFDELDGDSSSKLIFEKLIQNPLSTHEQIFGELSDWTQEFEAIYNLPQDSKWHNLSVSRHTYEVWKYVIENYQGDDKFLMLCVAVLHDVGKAYCKNFKEGSRHANFISHENASSQIACDFLSWLGYDKDFILDVCELVQLHMRMLGISMGEDGEKARKKLLEFIGEEKFNKLKFFREADEQAK